MKKLQAAVILLVSLLGAVCCGWGFLQIEGDAAAQFAMDRSGETALLSSDGSLSKYSAGGVLLWSWRPEEEGVYTGLAADRSGTLYFCRQVHTRQVDAQGQAQDIILREEVLSLSADGNTFSKVLTVDRTDRRDQSGLPYIVKLQPREDLLLAVCQKDGGYELLTLDPYHGTEPQLTAGYSLDGQEAASLAVVGDKLAAAAPLGELWLLSADGSRESLKALTGPVWADGLSADIFGNLCFTDLKGAAFYQLNPQEKSVTRVFNGGDAVFSEKGAPVFSSLRQTASTADGAYFAVSAGGEKPSYYRFGDGAVTVSALRKPFDGRLLLICLGIFAGAALALWVIWTLAARIDRKNALGGRILRRFVPVCVLIFTLVGGVFLTVVWTEAKTAQGKELEIAAKLASQEWTAGQNRQALEERLVETAAEAASLTGREDIGLLLYTLDQDVLWCTLHTLERDGFFTASSAVPAAYELGTDIAGEILALGAGKTLRFYKDGVCYNGFFLPILDQDGRVAGFAEARAEAGAALTAGVAARLMLVVILTAAAACLLICALTLTLRRAFLPLWELNRCIGEIGAGNWRVKAEITSRDELADIGISFNGMVEKLNQYIANMMLLNNEYVKFVPRALFQLLGKTQVTELSPGDQCVRELTLLYISFAPEGEGAADDSRAYFEMLGQHLDRLFDTAEKNRGIIERFDGSGIVALFPLQTQDAVNTAIAAKELLADDPLAARMKMVVSVSPTLIGVAGSEKRQSIVAISDTILGIYALSGLMDDLGVRYVLTQRAMDSIGGEFYFQYREVGSGSTGGESLYEFLDGMAPYEKKLRLATKDIFEQGVRDFQKGRYAQARRRFVQVLQVNEKDAAAVRYLVLCDRRQQEKQ